MAENRRILAHVLIETNSLASQGAEATKAALRSAIQVGLNAQVLELNVYPIAAEDGASHVKAQIPHQSRPTMIRSSKSMFTAACRCRFVAMRGPNLRPPTTPLS